MSFNKWPKRSAEKNYFMVPNEIFSIGLDFREISIYSYLLRCENRKTYFRRTVVYVCAARRRAHEIQAAERPIRLLLYPA